MNIVETILQFDTTTRLALGGLALTTVGWLLSMLAALVSKRDNRPGFSRVEIAVAVLSFLHIGSLTLTVRALAPEPEPDRTALAAAPSSGGGTGTCASVRPGMSANRVRTLLGEPSLSQSAEDTGGPGATVMVFDESRCVVRLTHGIVEQVE